MPSIAPQSSVAQADLRGECAYTFQRRLRFMPHQLMRKQRRELILHKSASFTFSSACLRSLMSLAHQSICRSLAIRVEYGYRSALNRMVVTGSDGRVDLLDKSAARLACRRDRPGPVARRYRCATPVRRFRLSLMSRQAWGVMPGQPYCAQWKVGQPEIFGHSCLVKRPTTGRARFMQASFTDVGDVGFNYSEKPARSGRSPRPPARSHHRSAPSGSRAVGH